LIVLNGQNFSTPTARLQTFPNCCGSFDKLPSSKGKSEPGFSIWSALAHQGDVYTASFAAVPHVIEALATDPLKASEDYFHFPAWMEICRRRKGIDVPEDLKPAYFAALAKLPDLVCTAAKQEWRPEFLVCALSALAVSKNAPEIADAILELAPDTITEFQSWQNSR
jgi:hypothetical protein